MFQYIQHTNENNTWLANLKINCWDFTPNNMFKKLDGIDMEHILSKIIKSIIENLSIFVMKRI